MKLLSIALTSLLVLQLDCAPYGIVAEEKSLSARDPFKHSEKIKDSVQKSIAVLSQEKESLEKSAQAVKKGSAAYRGYELKLQEVGQRITNLETNLGDYTAAQQNYRQSDNTAVRDQARMQAENALNQIEVDRVDLAILLEQSNPTSPVKSKKAFDDLINVRITKSPIASAKKKSIRTLDLNNLADNIIAEASKQAQESLGNSFSDSAAKIRQVLNTIPKPLIPTQAVNAATQAALKEFNMRKQVRPQDIDGNLELLNKTYRQVITALKQLDPASKFPNELSLKSLQDFAKIN